MMLSNKGFFLILLAAVTTSLHAQDLLDQKVYDGSAIQDYQDLIGLTILPITSKAPVGEVEKIQEGDLKINFTSKEINVTDKTNGEVDTYIIEGIDRSENLLTVSVQHPEWNLNFIFDLTLNEKQQLVSIEILGRMMGIFYGLPNYDSN